MYYGYEGNYTLIQASDAGLDANSEWIYYLNWGDESARRNYTSSEKYATDAIVGTYADITYDGDGTTVLMARYLNNIKKTKDRIGTAYSLFLDGENRTFIGSSKLYGVSQNYNVETDTGICNEVFYARQSQRWHFTIGLPSSSVFVEAGKPCTKENIEALTNTNSVIVCTLNIKAQGTVWALEYDGTAINFEAGEDKGFTVYPDEDPILPPTEDDGTPTKDPVAVIYNKEYTSTDDLRTEGTH